MRFRIVCVTALAIAAVMVPTPASSHFKLLMPPSALADGRSVSAPIDPSPKIPVLADGALVHDRTPPKNTEWQMDVTLPNLDCERCTLQVIQFMAVHVAHPGGGFYYHHCADLKITADPNLPPADKAWFASTQP